MLRDLCPDPSTCRHHLVVAGLVVVLLIVGILLPSTFASIARAQTDATSPATPASPPTTQPTVQPTPGSDIFQLPDNSQEITELRDLYRDQLERYRREEQQRSVAEQQYFNLETLAAFDRYVQESKEVVAVRDDVLITHLSLQRLTLEETAGVNVDEKARALELTEQLINALKQHQTRNESVTDRDQLLASLERFAQLRPQVQLLSKQISLLTKLGQLQDSIDRAESLANRLETEITEAEYLATNRRDELSRSIVIAQETINRSQVLLDEYRAEIDTTQLERGNLSTLVNDLEDPYVEIRRGVNFLEELIDELREDRETSTATTTSSE